MKTPVPDGRLPGRRHWIARALVALLCLAFVAARFGDLHFFLDNLSNFPVHFAAAFVLAAIALARLGDRRFALLPAATAILALLPVLPWYLPQAAQASEGAAVRLLVSNVHFQNREHARILRLIEEVQPEVVGLVEVNARWLQALEPLRAAYPFRFEAPEESFAGLALYSRLPLSDARILRIGHSGSPVIAATMTTPDGEVEFILAHPMSPVSAWHFHRRNEEMRALGRYVGGLKRPIVIAGDLNATMWNRHYLDFVESTSLHNARAGRGVGPSWPAIRWLGVPIDHILATASVTLRNFRVHDSIGSDHLPISAEFSLR